jgi:hypothetical protein
VYKKIKTVVGKVECGCVLLHRKKRDKRNGMWGGEILVSSLRSWLRVPERVLLEGTILESTGGGRERVAFARGKRRRNGAEHPGACPAYGRTTFWS